MRLIANIIWFLFGGLWLGLLWLISGLILCITILGIPLGTQCFKAARLSFMPFGKRVVLNFQKHPIAKCDLGTCWRLGHSNCLSGFRHFELHHDHRNSQRHSVYKNDEACHFSLRCQN